ncbi:MAG TPA: ABC transporter ATP-binding protein [Thermoplasmata archaeon]|nr:ABC transporter ATP-binding protein [Thermoplasmata archaeon]
MDSALGRTVPTDRPPARSAPESFPPPSTSPAFVCRGVVKRFGAQVALSGISMEVSRGAVLGLLGPNGAGKTTLIRILLGLTAPTSGTAEVLGRPVPPGDALRRIGYMPQNRAIYTDLSVEQNLRFFGRLLGLDRRRLSSRIHEVLDLVALGERRRSLVAELSGGMQRRVSLAAALLADPDLLLLDEPTVGVDPELRADFWEYFRGLARQGRTVVMTTHYMEEATECSHVAMLHRGALLAYDTPQAVRARARATTMDEAFLHIVRERAPEARQG